MAFVEWVITVSAPSFLVDSIFHILTNCLLFLLFSGTSSQLTGLYCLSPEAMPMVHSWDDPLLIDSVVSKRQRPHMQGPGWYLCFNEAKVMSVFICEAALSQLELKVSPVLWEDHKPTSPLCWVVKTCQVLLHDSFRGTSLPTSFCEKVASRSKHSFLSMTSVKDTPHGTANKQNSSFCWINVRFILCLGKSDNGHHREPQIPQFID